MAEVNQGESSLRQARIGQTAPYPRLESSTPACKALKGQEEVEMNKVRKRKARSLSVRSERPRKWVRSGMAV